MGSGYREVEECGDGMRCSCLRMGCMYGCGKGYFIAKGGCNGPIEWENVE